MWNHALACLSTTRHTSAPSPQRQKAMDISIKLASDSFRTAARATLIAFLTVIGLALIVPDADAARRMGGGKSFGRQSQQATPPSQPAQRESLGQPAGQPGATQAAPGMAGKPAAAAPAAGNRFLGPLGGLAAGLGIAALLSHFGLIGPFAEFLTAVLMIGLLVVAGLFVLRMLRGAGRKGEVGQRSMEPAYQTPSAARVAMPPTENGTARPGSLAASLSGSGLSDAQPAGARAPGVPDDFDVDGFLRSAKVHFHRLQAAWDRKDVDDLSEFTTPEVLAELRMQLSEQGSHSDRNEVADLDAELLGIEEGPLDYLASVRFSGTTRSVEAPGGEAFQEVWNLSKRKDGRGGWLLAGIQQVH